MTERVSDEFEDFTSAAKNVVEDEFESYSTPTMATTAQSTPTPTQDDEFESFSNAPAQTTGADEFEVFDADASTNQTVVAPGVDLSWLREQTLLSLGQQFPITKDYISESTSEQTSTSILTTSSPQTLGATQTSLMYPLLVSGIQHEIDQYNRGAFFLPKQLQFAHGTMKNNRYFLLTMFS